MLGLGAYESSSEEEVDVKPSLKSQPTVWSFHFHTRDIIDFELSSTKNRHWLYQNNPFRITVGSPHPPNTRVRKLMRFHADAALLFQSQLLPFNRICHRKYSPVQLSLNLPMVPF